MRLSYDELLTFLSFLRVDVDNEPGDLNIVCLQSLVPKGAGPGEIGGEEVEFVPNIPDQYNDGIFLAYKHEDGSKHLASLLGTLEPGRFYTKTDPNPLGAAHLTFGQHLYTTGTHKGHPALRSLNLMNRIWRDQNGNFRPDQGEVVYVGEYGINVHAGGKSFYIGQWSAGCINVAGGWDGKGYRLLLERAAVHVASHEAIRLTAWWGIDLIRFFERGWSHRPTLVLGMRNGWVAEMQRLLNEAGANPALVVDGDWRAKTTDALTAFQARRGLEADGWCGPQTWAALVTPPVA